MATQVLIAHTGQRLECDTAQFSSLDDLKNWVARNSSISADHIVALTLQGRSVKLASIHAEKEILIYDIRVSQPTTSSNAQSIISDIPLPKRYSAPDAPNSINDVQAIASWQDLYKERRNWAMRLAEDCAGMSGDAQARFDEIDVIAKCLDAAVANLENSIKQIEPKHAELKKWVKPALAEHATLAASWEKYLRLARNVPISSPMVKFMTRGQVDKAHPTLDDLIELDTAKKAGKLAPTAHRRFNDKASELEKAAAQMYRGLDGLIEEFNRLMQESTLEHSDDSSHLLEDIEAVAKQIDSDYRSALGYGGSQRDLAQASKTASNHTERLVPSLKKRATDMSDMARYATNARNHMASESASFMRTITDITALHSNVKNLINVLNQSEDDMTTFDYLRLIQQLPYMYASFLVEAIRRREWVEKVKSDSSTLANEMAVFQDEESKRRRKWQKMVGSTYGPGLDTNVVGLEVNLMGEDIPWPVAGKEELDKLLQILQDQEAEPSMTQDVAKLVEEMHNPTKQQSKRLKAFKNGSVHEAALGRSGLLIRGDDDLLRSLQDDKGRLENKLKTAESRVRRLEDLLHRQSQASRPGNLFQPSSAQQRERRESSSSVKSNRPDDRRRSSDGADPLLRRIAQLENELREEKQKSTRLQTDYQTRTTEHDDLKGRMDQANSTKQDLMRNMEALKREFDDERKSLEDEIKTLKARIEDTEDEMDNFGESREHEKAGYDEKVRALEAQIEGVEKEHKDEILKAHGQVHFLRNEARVQREQQEALEREIRIAQEGKDTLSQKLSTVEETSSNQLDLLKKLHLQLAPDQDVPEDLLDLTDGLVSLATDQLAKLQDAEREFSLAKADLGQAKTSVKDLREELALTKSKLAEEETSVARLREGLSEETAKVQALESELVDERHQLSSLRAKLSDGEFGSETLQNKLEEAEKRATELHELVASRQSQVGSLEEELRTVKEKQGALQDKLSALNRQYESRDLRTKDLTQRIYSQNDRICRLLERLGYSTARKDGEMTITRIPRSERSSQNPNDSSDPGSSIRRSISLGGQALHESADLELLYWIHSDASAEAEKYEAFIKALGYFDTEQFSDTIYQRIKETEHKARKWQREARAYRERAHNMQRDAHEKIAFKHFKEGDLALFLPTRNQQAGAWAAFNVGFPHYFLREQDSHRLRHREWLVARINRVQERVVDLSKSLQPNNETDSANDDENDNPFQLSDGLRWYLIDAQEDKAGAPATPGMGKSTVAANTVEATANLHTHTPSGKGKNRDSVTSIEGINKTLSKSLDSRRSSTGSKKGALPFQIGGGASLLKSNAVASETNSLRAAPDTSTGTSPTHGGHLSPNMGTISSVTQAETPVDAAEGRPTVTHDTMRAENEGSQADPSTQTAAAKSPEPLLKAKREESMESSSKKSVVWDPLWSVDYMYESPKKK